jgi:hypothetical protein
MARRTIAYVIAATLVVCLPSIALPQEGQLSVALATILQDRESIRPGDTKARLEELFLPDGGLSSIEKRTYVSRRCAYVKVDVEFRKSEVGDSQAGKLVIVALSRLYVDYPKLD